jgi:hypothetical protein
MRYRICYRSLRSIGLAGIIFVSEPELAASTARLEHGGFEITSIEALARTPPASAARQSSGAQP